MCNRPKHTYPFSEKLLEKVDQEDIGYIITDEGKDDMVLCPARWFMYTFDDDFGCIINSALRYAIGRHTYMPSTVMRFVRRYLNVLDTRTIGVMIKDIERELPDEALYEHDEWLKLCNDLKVHLEKMNLKDGRKQQGGVSTE